MLYFSLLPSHLNIYFINNYLAKECGVIWDEIYKESLNIMPKLLAEEVLQINCMRYSARNGYLKLLKSIMEKRNCGYMVIFTLYNEASRRNHVDVIRWLYETYNIQISESAVYLAAEYGSLDVIKYSYEIGAPSLNIMWKLASQHGQIHILQYIIDEHKDSIASITVGIYQTAIQKGQLDTVKWIREKGFDWDEDMITLAIHYKQYTIAKWLLLSSDYKCSKEDRRAMLEAFNDFNRVMTSP